MDSPRVLVVEDDPDLRPLVADFLTTDGFTVSQADHAAAARDHLSRASFDAVVIDLRLPDADGMGVLEVALDRYPNIVSVVVTGHGGVTEAVAAIKRGAYDFLIKPFGLAQLARVLVRGLGQRPSPGGASTPPDGPEERTRFERIIGRSPAMEKLFATMSLVAPLDTTVLLQGETGTGKELVARAIHDHSPRADRAFVAFNAAAIPEGLAETELFGHARGAFTGAVAARAGRFEQAHLGTLFIDEVALMPMTLQSKLLRALQEREVERVGETRPIKFDARVIAATGADLARLVKEGSFREDLYFRLNVIRLSLPALRQRRDDIPRLARHFVRKICQHHGLPARTLGEDALRALAAHDWPGNVRELENAVEHAAAMSGQTREIRALMLPPDLAARTAPSASPSARRLTIPDDGIDLTAMLKRIELDMITQCLERTGGNKRQAARLLGLSRTTLIDKLNRHARQVVAPLGTSAVAS